MAKRAKKVELKFSVIDEFGVERFFRLVDGVAVELPDPYVSADDVELDAKTAAQYRLDRIEADRA